MKKSIIFWALTAVLFVIYFKILEAIWDKFMPWNTYIRYVCPICNNICKYSSFSF